jgi:hypothetical protein
MSISSRDRVAALDPDLDPIRINRAMLADRRENVLAENRNEIGIPRRASLVHQQYLQSLLSGTGRSLPAE